MNLLYGTTPPRLGTPPAEVAAAARTQRRIAIGYGLDFAERYRNLPYVAVLSRPGTTISSKPLV